VQSLFDSIAAADGLLLNKKFEKTASSPLTIVLSAFGDLCTLMQEKYSQEKQHSIYQQLQSEFGTNFHLFIGTVPSALKLAPSQTAIDSVINAASCENEVNYFSLCNIIQRFIKVVSSESSPVVIFLDDLQWADSVSLGIIHSVLADKSSTVFFVGTYRDNEVLPTHIIFGFLEWLAKFNIPLTSISIGGMPAEDVNAMVSDSLGIFPRLCEHLSQTVFRKTSGSPFYVQTFLCSLGKLYVDTHQPNN
jgi:predicted ATPase